MSEEFEKPKNDNTKINEDTEKINNNNNEENKLNEESNINNNNNEQSKIKESNFNLFDQNEKNKLINGNNLYNKILFDILYILLEVLELKDFLLLMLNLNNNMDI